MRLFRIERTFEVEEGWINVRYVEAPIWWILRAYAKNADYDMVELQEYPKILRSISSL